MEIGNLIGKKNKIIVGYDLGDDVSQISFCRFDEEEPETVSVITGEEEYDFPTALFRKPDLNQWVYGKEALKLAEGGNGILVENLLTLAAKGDRVKVGEETFDPAALLALFMKRSLSLLGMIAAPGQIEAFMVTVDKLDQARTEALTQALTAMQLPAKYIFLQTHGESFYQYMIHQPRELWMGQAMVCEYEDGRVKTYHMVCNRKTTPVAVLMEEKQYPDPRREDGGLLRILETCCGDRIISSAYLVGGGFEGEWYQNSLRFLCRGRRVFRGNNLYSKGACYGARERLMPGDIGKQHIFLGQDALKANLGMYILRGGRDSYYALLNAGMNWYEAKKQCEFYLESGNSFSLVIASLTGKGSKEVEIILNDLPLREERATRIRMELYMESDEDVSINLEDMGFGEIFPATHKIWHENLRLYD